MVWPFGSSSSSSDDPVNKLNPELREFLEQEAPKPQIQRKASTTKRPAAESEAIQTPPPESDPKVLESTVPPQSLFPDGRYAHLWKTYTPKDDAKALSDGEALSNITQSYEYRRKQTSNAALENCVFEALAEQDCWRNGSFSQKLWLCRSQTQALDRCTQLQTKFLHALGYLASEDRPPEVDDRIQMHADRLYQQMLSHEKATKLAKEQGLPAPEFKPVMSRENLDKVLGVQAADYLETAKQAEMMAAKKDLSHVSEKKRAKYEKHIADMTADERLIEEAVNVVTTRDTSALARDYQQYVGHKNTPDGQGSQGRQGGPVTIAERIRSLWSKE